MRVGISERFGMPGHDLAHVGRIARAIEANGFDSYWSPEHLAVRASGAAPELAAAPSFPDPFVNLTAVAAASSTLLLGTAVLLAPLQHPLAIARAGASLDALSGGRFVLGVGVGWEPWEYAALGVPWRDRGARASEHVEAVITLWRSPGAGYEGRHVTFGAVAGEPRPLARPHPPVLVGGNSDAALRRAARLGDGWFGWGLDRDALRAARGRLMELLSARGRDPQAFTVQLGTRFEGDTARLAEAAAEARAAGVDRLVVTCGPTASAGETELAQIAAACAPLGASDSALRTPSSAAHRPELASPTTAHSGRAKGETAT
jgi:probable F420-dependent oxidoreductase